MKSVFLSMLLYIDVIQITYRFHSAMRYWIWHALLLHIQMDFFSSRGRMLSVHDALFDYARLLLCANDADKIVKSTDEIVMLAIATNLKEHISYNEMRLV